MLCIPAAATWVNSTNNCTPGTNNVNGNACSRREGQLDTFMKRLCAAEAELCGGTCTHVTRKQGNHQSRVCNRLTAQLDTASTHCCCTPTTALAPPQHGQGVLRQRDTLSPGVCGGSACCTAPPPGLGQTRPRGSCRGAHAGTCQHTSTYKAHMHSRAHLMSHSVEQERPVPDRAALQHNAS